MQWGAGQSDKDAPKALALVSVSSGSFSFFLNGHFFYCVQRNTHLNESIFVQLQPRTVYLFLPEPHGHVCLDYRRRLTCLLSKSCVDLRLYCSTRE